MVKYRMTRKRIDDFLKKHGKGNIYDIEDYLMSKNKNHPDRKSILGILNKDPRYMVIGTQISENNGRKTEIKLFGLKEELDVDKSD